MVIRNKVILAASLSVLAVSSAAFAQSTPVDGHPRVNEVQQRLDAQQTRTDAGVASVTINAKQEARDNARDAKIAGQLSADEAKNGGHVTKAEQKHMNKELDRNSHDIKRQKEAPGSATAK